MIIGSRATLQQIANGIYEAIRLKLVEEGLIVNRSLYSTAAAYNAAVKILEHTLLSQGKQIIEVRNTGASEERNASKVNTFFINEKEHTPGSIHGGKFSMEDYIDPEDDTRKFRKVRQPQTQDIGYEVRYKAADKKTESLMSEILSSALGERDYIYSYNDDGTAAGDFLITYKGTLDMSDGRKLEKRAQYTCIDMLIYEPKVIQTGIPEATAIIPMIDEQTAQQELDPAQFLPDDDSD